MEPEYLIMGDINNTYLFVEMKKNCAFDNLFAL